MNQDNRVLSRQGARELVPSETGHVSGGVHTETKCTFNPQTREADGDAHLGEC